MASGPGNDGNRVSFGANPSPPSFVTSFNNTRPNEMTSYVSHSPLHLWRICNTDYVGLEIESEELRRFLLISALQVARSYRLLQRSLQIIIHHSLIPLRHLDQYHHNSKSCN